MTTVINNPTPTSNDNSGSGMGMIVGVVVVVVVLFLLFFYGMPFFRGESQQYDAVEQPIQIPDEVDINVNQNP